MSRPHLNIHTISYTASIMTITYTYLKLRAGGTVSVVGLPSAQTLTPRNIYSGRDTSTFSIALSASNTFNISLSYPKLTATSINTYRLSI